MIIYVSCIEPRINKGKSGFNWVNREGAKTRRVFYFLIRTDDQEKNHALSGDLLD